MTDGRRQAVYLDNNATTAPLPAVVDAATETLGSAYGNPSSAHTPGDLARNLLSRARSEVADLLGCEPEHLIFTGSGTEANNLAVHSLVHAGAWRLVTSVLEHSSILQHAAALERQGLEVIRVRATAAGRIDLDALEAALSGVDRPVLAMQWVNNETGVIQPIAAIVALARRYGALVHIDAAQAAGKLPTALAALDPDFLSVTAHKLNGPRGVGALYVKDRRLLRPIRFGGGQEGGHHPGTENLAGIVGFGAAARARANTLDASVAHMAALRDAFESRVLEICPWARVNGAAGERVANTTNIRFAGIDGEALMARLDGAGVYCSQSSACTNQRPEPSHVLRAMGLTEAQAYESVRFSTGVLNTHAEMEAAAETVAGIANELKRLFA